MIIIIIIIIIVMIIIIIIIIVLIIIIRIIRIIIITITLAWLNYFAYNFGSVTELFVHLCLAFSFVYIRQMKYCVIKLVCIIISVPQVTFFLF